MAFIRTHPHRTIVSLLASMLTALAVAGCTVGPDFKPPGASMPDGWVDVRPAPAPALAPAPGTESTDQVAAADKAASVPVVQAPDIERWWSGFNDPILSDLIERAEAANLDVIQAEARIRAARAARTIVAAGGLPTLNASAGYSRAHVGHADGGSQTSGLYQIGFDAAWEIDIFGGNRRGVEAAEADVQSAIEDRNSVLVTLTAELATAYFDLRGQQNQLAITRSNLQAQEQSAEITRQRQLGGYVSQLDVAGAEAQMANTQSQIPPLESAIRQSIYALGVLLGQQPASLLEELTPEGALPPVPPEVPVGLPSELLRRRPDIRLAESNLHGATARIGVATADLFPKFSLNGSVGLQGSSLSALGMIDNNFWSIGPSITWPIFAGGQIRANIELQEALTDESYAAYQQTVLVALQEVENSLVAYVNEQQRHDALVRATSSNRQAVDLARQLYVAGRTDFLNVLAAQRALFDSEDSLSQSDTLMVTNLVALYKALGGGWTVLPAP